MPKIRLFFLINEFNVGGVERSLLALVRSLPRERYDITIGVANRRGGLLEHVPAHVKVLEIESLHRHWEKLYCRPSSVMRSVREGKFCEAFGSLWSILRSRIEGTAIPHFRYFINEKTEVDMPEYDVAVAYQGPSEIVDYYIGSLVKAPVKLGWIHFDIDNFFARDKAIRQIYPSFDRIMLVSDQAKAIFDRRFPSLADKTEVMFNIIDREAIMSLSCENDVYTPEPDMLNIVTVGRIQDIKGQDIAIEAARLLKERGVALKWYLVGEGSQSEEYKELAKTTGVENEVIFTGALTNPYPYMKGCDVYVQPSRSEGFCIAIGEAKLFGVPIVATDFVGAREQLTCVPNAIIIPQLDATTLANAIEEAAQRGRIKPEAPGIAPQVERLEELFRI